MLHLTRLHTNVMHFGSSKKILESAGNLLIEWIKSTKQVNIQKLKQKNDDIRCYIRSMGSKRYNHELTKFLRTQIGIVPLNGNLFLMYLFLTTDGQA